MFEAGEQILQIDPEDYELTVEERESALAKAEGDMRLEMGQQIVALEEFELLGQEVSEEDKELLLREPQLEMSKAAVLAAKASLAKAELDLKRTKVVAPFNAMVQEEKVDIGARVGAGSSIGSFVGTDTYWVRATVPVDELRWINVPGFNSDEGSQVRIFHEAAWGPDVFREGRVERLMTNLEPQGRMARLLIAVEDPLCLSSNENSCLALILDSYVRVEIEGDVIPDVVRLPRTALREGDNVWLISGDNRLEVREVEIVWSANEHVCVKKGLGAGDILITSDLPTPVEDMKLRLAGEANEPLGEEGENSAARESSEQQQ
jgi:RND family efflux transporter MFP subunit